MTAKELLEKYLEITDNDLLFSEADSLNSTELGEITVVDEDYDHSDQKRHYETTVVYFKDHELYLLENRYYCWGELTEVTYSTVKPKEVIKVVYDVVENLS